MVWNSIKNAIGLGDPLANEPAGPFITLADLELLNTTPRLSGELDQVAGLQGADGVDTLGELSQLGGDGLNLRRRRLRSFALAGTDRDQSREGEQESLRMTHSKKAFAGLCSVPESLAAKVCRYGNRHAQKTFDSAQLKR